MCRKHSDDVVPRIRASIINKRTNDEHPTRNRHRCDMLLLFCRKMTNVGSDVVSFIEIVYRTTATAIMFTIPPNRIFYWFGREESNNTVTTLPAEKLWHYDCVYTLLFICELWTRYVKNIKTWFASRQMCGWRYQHSTAQRSYFTLANIKKSNTSFQSYSIVFTEFQFEGVRHLVVIKINCNRYTTTTFEGTWNNNTHIIPKKMKCTKLLRVHSEMTKLALNCNTKPTLWNVHFWIISLSLIIWSVVVCFIIFRLREQNLIELINWMI